MALGLYISGSLIGGLAVLCVFSLCKLFLYDLHYVKKFDKFFLGSMRTC
jgi:hypothetical protein